MTSGSIFLRWFTKSVTGRRFATIIIPRFWRCSSTGGPSHTANIAKKITLPGPAITGSTVGLFQRMVPTNPPFICTTNNLPWICSETPIPQVDWEGSSGIPGPCANYTVLPIRLVTTGHLVKPTAGQAGRSTSPISSDSSTGR